MKTAPDGKYWGNHFMPADGANVPRDRWTRNRVNTVFFDNVVIAKQYVGPVKD